LQITTQLVNGDVRRSAARDSTVAVRRSSHQDSSLLELCPQHFYSAIPHPLISPPSPFYVIQVMTTLQSQSHNGHSNGNNVGMVGMTMNGLSNVSQNYVNPAQMTQTVQPGPPPANGSQKKKPPPNAKRRRTDPPDDSATQQRKNRDGPRKKKANRACFHCQKAHLTCDDCELFLRTSFSLINQ
jgi:hypothetical protein